MVQTADHQGANGRALAAATAKNRLHITKKEAEALVTEAISRPNAAPQVSLSQVCRARANDWQGYKVPRLAKVTKPLTGDRAVGEHRGDDGSLVTFQCCI